MMSFLSRTQSLLSFIVIFFLAVSCDFSGESDEEACENTACTLIFISLNVEVVNSADAPLALDSYTVTDVQSGRDVTPNFSNTPFEDMQASGNYTFFNDSWADEYRNESTVLRFSGLLDGMEVVTAEFEVMADCCHVSLVSGDTKIIVD